MPQNPKQHLPYIVCSTTTNDSGMAEKTTKRDTFTRWLFLPPKWLVILLLAGVFPVSSFGANEISSIEGPQAPVPILIVPPEFPADAKLNGESAIVELIGKVSVTGEFTVEKTSGDEPFVSAVNEVRDWWRFVAAIDSQTCSASNGDMLVRVTFTGTVDDPHIFVSLPKDALADGKKTELTNLSWARRTAPKFPMSQHHVKEALAIVLAKVTPDGKFNDVNVLASIPTTPFGKSAKKAVKKWRFAEPSRPEKTTCVRQRINYCVPPFNQPSFLGCTNEPTKD